MKAHWLLGGFAVVLAFRTAEAQTPPTAPTVTSLAAADARTCAVLSDGSARCWGDNTEQSLGDGTRTPRSTPTRVTAVDDVLQVAMAARWGCAIRRGVPMQGGAVQCWGALGPSNGASNTHPRAVTVTGLNDAMEIALTANVGCARRRFGSVVCWNASYNARGETEARPVRNVLNVLELVAGDTVFAARDRTGGVMLFGASAAFTDVAGLRPRRWVGPTRVAHLAAGRATVCARTMTNQIACVRAVPSSDGGFTTQPMTDVPRVATGVVEVVVRPESEGYACVLGANGAITCRSDGDVFATLAGATSVVMGNDHVCGRTARGEVLCNARASSMACGDGASAWIARPLQVLDAGGARALYRTHAGLYVTRGDGSIAWLTGPPVMRDTVAAGRFDVVSNNRGIRWDEAGRLESWFDYNPPTVVTGIGPVQTVFTNDQRGTCGLLRNGTVTCWGQSFGGPRLGALTPTSLPGATGVTGLTLGSAHACFWNNQGEVRCLGANADRQCEDIEQAIVPEPTLIPEASPARMVDAGRDLTCAVRRDGRVVCWGRWGGPRRGATLLEGIENAAEVSVDSHDGGCVRTVAGEVFCWGENATGLVGDGTLESREDPYRVEGLRDVAELAVGEQSACARQRNGAVWCWGYLPPATRPAVGRLAPPSDARETVTVRL